MIDSLNIISFQNITLEIRDRRGIEFTMTNGDGQPVDLYDYDDPLEFNCYRLHKPYSNEPILYLSIQEKYHDTFINYELDKIE